MSESHDTIAMLTNHLRNIKLANEEQQFVLKEKLKIKEKLIDALSKEVG
jgi:hypothetical protein